MVSIFLLTTQLFVDVFFVVTDPTGVRISVAGNILALKQPRGIWAKYFEKDLPVSTTIFMVN